MTRRKFLEYISAILCYLSLPGRALARAISDEAILKGLLDALIPSGDTPGAKDVGLHRKVLSMLELDSEKRDIYRDGLDMVRESLGPDNDTVDWIKAVEGIERSRFFREFRRDAMRMFYSDPVSWDSIGYEGPPLVGYSDYHLCGSRMKRR